MNIQNQWNSLFAGGKHRWPGAPPRIALMAPFWGLMALGIGVGLNLLAGGTWLWNHALDLRLQLLAAFVSLLILIWAIRLHTLSLQAFLQGPSEIRPFYPSPRLITHSIYAKHRHPMYLAGFLYLLTLGIWLSLPYGIAPMLGFYTLIAWWFIQKEEKHLLSQFGLTYAQYRTQTPLLFRFKSPF